MGTTVTGDRRQPPAPSPGEPAGRLGLGLRAEDSGEEAKQNSTSGSGPGEAEREGKTHASRLGRPPGPVALSPTGPSTRRMTSRQGEGIAEPAFGQGCRRAPGAPVDVICLLGKNAGARAPAGVAGHLNPGVAVRIRTVTGLGDGGAAPGQWEQV